MTQKELGWAFFLLFLGLLIYWNGLTTPFLWDEKALILADPRVHHGSLFPEIFKKPFYPGRETAFATYYRPLSTLSFRVDYSFWGLNPLGYHLTNLLLHLLNALLVYALFLHFFGSPELSFFGGFLFLAHPAHVEAVTYIPSRTDVLSFFFFLASFHFYVAGRRALKKFRPYGFSVLCYGLALLSKERATFLPLLVFAHALLINREKTKWKGAEGVLLLSMFSCVGMMVLVRQHLTMPVKGLLDLPRLPLRLFVLPEILFVYARIWFFPWPLHVGRIIPIEVLSVRTLIVEWSSFLVFLTAGLVFFRKPLERFWIAWIGVALLPVVQIFPIYFNSPHLRLAISEYLLYYASAGLIGLLATHWGSFLIAKGDESLLTSKPVIALGAILTLFCFMVIWRNGEYHDPITFFEQTLHHAPWHATAYNQLGVAYSDGGALEEGEKNFQKAISIEPRSAAPYANLALLAYKRGDTDKATQLYQKAFQFSPDNSIVLYSLGYLANQRGEWQKAIPFLERATKINPYENIRAYRERARSYWELGEKKKAVGAIEEALKVFPGDPILQETRRHMQEEHPQNVFSDLDPKQKL